MKTKTLSSKKISSSIPLIKNALTGMLLSGAMFVSSFSTFAQESTDYYWRGQDWNGDYKSKIVSLWKTDASGTVSHQTVPSETSNIFFDVNNSSMVHVRMDQTISGLKVNSVTATVATEINMVHSMSVVSDWTSYVNADAKYVPTYAAYYASSKSIRIVTDNVDFLSVGGNMTLTTDKYFNTRFRLGVSQTFSDYTLTVGGALNFVKNGADTVGYHAFDMIASDSNTGTLFDLDIGGLNSSGKAVYMTTAKNGTVGINFYNNSSGAFAGGSFEGVFATESGVSSQLYINMNGSGTQSITIYKAANGSQHGFENDLDGKKDMSIGFVTVNRGKFVMNTEVAVENLYLYGGTLQFSSPEKVGGLTIDSGDSVTLLFDGTIKTGDLFIGANPIDIVFSAEDLTSQKITVFEFDYLQDKIDVESVFTAYDESGKILGGEFELVVEGDAGSLIYTVPEPEAIAALFGIAALVFALRRRK